MLSAQQALDRLRAGNQRFLAASSKLASPGSAPIKRVPALAQGQSPFAVVLGCADSRVPMELVFDEGPGELFVVRVAGNIAAPSQIGSVEFAAEVLGTRLVVVLGHSRCGAVSAAVDCHSAGEGAPEGHLGSIVKRILPAVDEAARDVERGVERDVKPDADDALLTAAIRANVRRTVRSLGEESPVLARLLEEDGLAIVGAEYALETGAVSFL